MAEMSFLNDFKIELDGFISKLTFDLMVMERELAVY